MNEEAKWRVCLSGGIPQEMPYENCIFITTCHPFSLVEFWNGHSWEVVWNGAVEFEGVAP